MKITVVFSVIVGLFFPHLSVASSLLGKSDLEWARAEQKFNDTKWVTTLTFYSEKNRKLGMYFDNRGRSLVPADNDGWMREVVVIDKKRLLITAWLDGARTHIYRVFDPSLSPSKPICEIYGHGDPKIEFREGSKGKLELKAQVSPGKFRWKSC